VPSNASAHARRIWEVVEPIAAAAYFAPEAHAAYEALGFKGSGGAANGLQFPDMVAYFLSRGACLGKVQGEVIAAAFGVFKREMVVDAVDRGWDICGDPAPVLAARQDGTTAALERVLGTEPEGMKRATELLLRAAAAAPGEGRHLFSGLQSLGLPGTPMGDFWRAADLVREHRGDSHIAAWIGADLDACEIGVITDVWRGAPVKSWVRSRGWSNDEMDGAVERLRGRDLLRGDAISPAGWEMREGIDLATDLMESRVVDALGDDIDELFAIMDPIAAKAVEGRLYPAAVAWGQRPES